MLYKGFKIVPDKKLGYSLIDRKGKWACSKTGKEELEEIVDDILDKEN